MIFCRDAFVIFHLTISFFLVFYVQPNADHANQVETYVHMLFQINYNLSSSLSLNILNILIANYRNQ